MEAEKAKLPLYDLSFIRSTEYKGEGKGSARDEDRNNKENVALNEVTPLLERKKMTTSRSDPILNHFNSKRTRALSLPSEQEKQVAKKQRISHP